jgi:hypothetical protein
MSDRSQTAADLPLDHKRVAVKWLVWEHGMTVDEACSTIEQWPVSRKASEAVDVATFIVEECHGR